MKTCFKCNRTLQIDEFYAHPMMADGHLGKCKDCTRADTIANREKRLEYYREYDKRRSPLPKRAALRRRVGSKYYEEHPGRVGATQRAARAAWRMVN